MRQIWAREDYDGTQYPFFDTVRTPVPLSLPNGTGGLVSPAQNINKTGDYINQKTFSEELQVQGQFFDDALQLTTGAYYQKDKPATDRLLRIRITLSKVKGQWLMSNLTTL